MPKIRPFIQMAFASLVRHKLRSLLNILGVVCGVMAVMSMISIGEGAKEKVLQDIEGLGLRNIYINRISLTEKQMHDASAQRSYGVSWSDVEKLRFDKSVIKNVAAFREITAEILATKTVVTPKIIQSTPNYLHVIGITIAEGRFLLPVDEQKNNLVCVLGASVANQLGRDGQLGKNLRIGDTLYRIVGILTEQSVGKNDTAKVIHDNYNETLFLPFSRYRRAAVPGTEGDKDGLSRILVEIKNGRLVPEAKQFIDRMLEVAHYGVRDYLVIVPQELLKQSMRTQRLFNVVLAVIGGISLLVGGIGIMNIMLATVSERKHEIGLRRAIGATRRDVTTQFLSESVLLTLSGGILGICLGLIIIICVEGFTGWPIRVTPIAIAVPFLLAVLTGVFFGLYPAVKAAQMDPIKALNAV